MPAPKLSLKGRALRYLSIREHSRLELARKLSKYVQEGEDLKAVLDWLEASKFLSEERFTESLIHRRAARFGNNRILSELQSHGIDAGKLGTLKSDLADDETSRAREVWRRRFGEPPADAAERAKQMRFLQQRGFSHRAIQAVMRHPESDPDAEE